MSNKQQIENERLLMQSLVDQIGNDNTPATRGAVKIRLSNMIDRLVSKPEKEEEWISCEDRVPEEETECLVYFEGYGVKIDEFTGGRFTFNGPWKAICWRKLPSPPKSK